MFSSFLRKVFVPYFNEPVHFDRAFFPSGSYSFALLFITCRQLLPLSLYYGETGMFDELSGKNI